MKRLVLVRRFTLCVRSALSPPQASRKSHGAHVVLADVDLVVPPHARIGLVGPNGAGKSTLLRLLGGLDAADAGTIRRNPPLLAVGHLPQERDPLAGETLHGYLARRTGVGAAAALMDGLAARLAAEPDLAEPYSEALDAYLERGGADFDARASAVLAELGLGVELERPLDGLSGGEAARAALASILLSRYDVLLLDEPTNDLDFAGLARLEAFLTGFEGSVVIVSHDRAFLDRTVTRIVELDEWTHGAREYAGGWSEYEAERERRLARHHEQWEGYVSERERVEEQAQRMQRWEERGYGQGRKKKKSKDVKKAFAKKLDRLEAVEKPYEPWQLRLGLARSGAERRCRRAAGARGGDAGRVPARPARPRGELGRADRDHRPERQRQDDAARRFCSAGSRSTQGRVGSAPVSSSATSSNGGPPSPARSDCSTRSCARAGSSSRRRARCSRSSISARMTYCGPVGRSHRANGRAR